MNFNMRTLSARAIEYVPSSDARMAPGYGRRRESFQSPRSFVNTVRDRFGWSSLLQEASPCLSDTLPDNLDATSQAIWTEAQSSLQSNKSLYYSVDSVGASESSLTSGDSIFEPNADELSLSFCNMRKLIGRGAEYYEIFGTVHAVPLGFLDSLPLQYKQIQDSVCRSKTNPSVKGANPQRQECSFCKSFGRSNYKNHSLKSWQSGNITCPVLRAYKCPLCNNTNPDKAHTMRYCPLFRTEFAQKLPNACIESGNMKKASAPRSN